MLDNTEQEIRNLLIEAINSGIINKEYTVAMVLKTLRENKEGIGFQRLQSWYFDVRFPHNKVKDIGFLSLDYKVYLKRGIEKSDYY